MKAAQALLLSALAALAALPAGAALAQEPPDSLRPEDRRCLTCHAVRGLAVTLPSSDVLDLVVDSKGYGASVHAGKLACVDCHPGQAVYPHPPIQAANRRDYALGYYQVCGRCHFANYSRTLDSVHYEVLARGFRDAPTCTDCHGSHNIAAPSEPRSRIAQRCGPCHGETYTKYAESAHGSALLEEANPDVPVCTTCHGVHNIQLPRTLAMRYASVDLCARCHEDKELAANYGLSPKVSQTYLDDFHGKTIAFYREEGAKVWPQTPVCTDCHGVHDISPVDDPDSPVIKANLLATCQKCHPDATANFPSAWLSHYEPGPGKATLVYAVRLFYTFMIPTMLGGLALHVLLDIWRLARNR